MRCRIVPGVGRELPELSPCPLATSHSSNYLFGLHTHTALGGGGGSPFGTLGAQHRGTRLLEGDFFPPSTLQPCKIRDNPISCAREILQFGPNP